MLLRNGRPRLDVELLRMERTSSARYSVRWPESANVDWSARRAMPTNLTCCPSSSKSDGDAFIFAFSSLMPIKLRPDERLVKNHIYDIKPGNDSSGCRWASKPRKHFQT